MYWFCYAQILLGQIWIFGKYMPFNFVILTFSVPMLCTMCIVITLQLLYSVLRVYIFPKNHIPPLPPFSKWYFYSPKVGTGHYRLAKNTFFLLSKRLCLNSSPYWISFSFPPFFPFFSSFPLFRFPFIIFFSQSFENYIPPPPSRGKYIYAYICIVDCLLDEFTVH